MGPVRVSADGRYFVDQDGKPFFWLGDTQWELFHAFSLADAKAILADRKAKGFTVLQVMLTGVGDGTKPDWAGQSPWVNDDPATPNEAYLKHVDAVVELGRQEGLAFALGVYHQVQARRFTLAKARTYARQLARRYRDMPNLIWSMYPQATPEFASICRELAAGLQAGDEGAHLITVHPDPSPASSSFLHGEPWLAFNCIQTWREVDLICPMVSHDYALQPTKPVVMAEGAYEGGTEYGFDVTPLWVRRQAYLSCLAGGHHSYGHNDSWRVLPTWREALDAPGARQMGVMRRVLERTEWWRGVPDPSAFADGLQDGPLPPVAMCADRGDWVLAYLCSNAPIKVRMDKIATGSIVEASWIDPRTADQTEIGRYSNTGVRSFSPPEGWEDAVLLLEASA